MRLTLWCMRAELFKRFNLCDQRSCEAPAEALFRILFRPCFFASFTDTALCGCIGNVRTRDQTEARCAAFHRCLSSASPRDASRLRGVLRVLGELVLAPCAPASPLARACALHLLCRDAGFVMMPGWFAGWGECHFGGGAAACTRHCSKSARNED